MLVIDIYSVLVWFTAIVAGSMGLVIFVGSKKTSSKMFSFNLAAYVVWITSFGFYIAATNSNLAEFLARFEYFMGGIIAAGFFYFCLLFPEDKPLNKWISRSIILLQLLFIPLYYKGLIVHNVTYIGGISRWAWSQGPLSFLFDISFDVFFIGGLIILYRKYSKRPPSIERTHLKFMFWGIIIAIIPTSLLNIILPRFGNFTLNWLGSIAGLMWLSVIFYSIVRYRNMNVKAIAAEGFVLIMAAVLFMNIFLGENTLGAIGKILTFIAFVIIGYFFIKSVLKESARREQVEVLNNELTDLNEHLQEKVDEQTKEIKQAYEVEKQARIGLEKLDKAKDEFILTTQHHLRTPLTIVKGYLQSYLSKKAPTADDESKMFISKASEATDRISSLVNEFLDISQMEVGKNILKKEELDPKHMIEEIFTDMGGEMIRKRIVKSIDMQKVKLQLDPARMKEALTNIIDNAVKYCNEGGTITIRGEKTVHPIEKKEIYRLSIQDTGIGMTKEELSHIFTQYFERGEEAEKINKTGRGIGLVVTKNIIEAHQGRIYAESEGRGKGSKFTVELPLG